MNFNATLIGQMITFGLLVLFTMKYVWPPIMQAMQDRQKRIADGLASAERGVREQELAKAKAAQMLKEAKQHAAEIVAQAQKRANEVIEQSKQEARVEGDRQLAAAKAEIEQWSTARASNSGVKWSLSPSLAPARFSSARSTRRPTPPCWMTWSRSSNHTDHANG